MREYTCVVCGEKGIDRSPGQNRKFCSKECQMRYWNRKRDGYSDECCKYNDGVACTDGKCNNCGWNPAVAKKRSEALNG